MIRILRIVALLMIVGVLSCSTTDITTPELAKYRTSFEVEFGVDADYPITFYKDSNSSVMGTCYYTFIGGVRFNQRIVINSHFWSGLNPDQKTLLLFHELSHCSLGQDHDESIFAETGCPRDNMHPYNIPRQCIQIYGVQYYIDSMKD